MADPLLDMTDVAAGYGASQVLFGLSLSVAAGEAVALMGRNGMGKTTAVRALTGLLPCQGGAIVLAGQAITAWPAHRVCRAGIGLVPEGRQVFPTLSVRENLVATARAQADGWTEERIYDLFPRLDERRYQMGRTLSVGEQKMTALGRALMTNPRLLVLDEATEGLAPLVRAEIWDCLSALKARGLSVLVIDKSLPELCRLAERVVVMEKGRAVWTGSAAKARSAKKVRALLGV